MIDPHLLEMAHRAFEATGASPDSFKRNVFGFLYRSPRAVRDREAVYTWLKDNTPMSGPDIAQATGGKRSGHSAVCTALRRARARLPLPPPPKPTGEAR